MKFRGSKWCKTLWSHVLCSKWCRLRVGAGLGHYFPSGHLIFFSSPLVASSNDNLLGSIRSHSLVGRMDRGCCCGVGPVVLSGISSGHMDHGIHETDGFMALRPSKLFGSKESSNHAKFPLQTTHLLFSKVPFTESSGELCYFWAGSISAWHQPGNWTVNILYGWPPLLLWLSIQRQRVCVVKGEGWGRERRLKV